MTSHQLRFIDMLKGCIAEYGVIEIEKQREAPFTGIDALGLDGVFPNKNQAEPLINTIEKANAA